MFQAARGWHQSVRFTSRDEAAQALFVLLNDLTGREFYVGETKAAPATSPAPKRRRKLVEEREAKPDAPCYGRRRRNQVEFSKDVAINCYGRCALTQASKIRCEAAHLVPHARKGGASFKNGLLLRNDIHKLFDAGHCAINPDEDTLRMYFSAAILESDEDLRALHGAALADTMHPINRDNLRDRWDAFSRKAA
ncbi:HNH endonuclease [Salmonella enterica]|nr:HNH endonuclease [Salmonella enterica]